MRLEGKPFLPSAASSAQWGRSPSVPGLSAGKERFSQTCETWENGTSLQNLSGDLSYAVQTSLSLCLCNRTHVWRWMSIRTDAQRLENRFTFRTESELLPPQSADTAGCTKEDTSPNKGARTPASLRAQDCFVTSI